MTSVQRTLENGRDLPIGEVDHTRSLPPTNTVALLDQCPGALLLPQYGISIIRGECVELLDLGEIAHCVISQGTDDSWRKEFNRDKHLENIHTKKNRKKEFISRYNKQCIDRCTLSRGSWFKGKFYPKGGSILDWDARWGGNSTTAQLYRARHGHTRRYRAQRRLAVQRIEQRRGERDRARQEGQAAARSDAQQNQHRTAAQMRNYPITGPGGQAQTQRERALEQSMYPDVC